MIFCRAPIIWRSTKQATVAESTTEAEFIACRTVSREVVWLRQFLEQLYSTKLAQPTNIFVDNQSAIKLVENNQVHSRIKHLDIRLLAIRERVENKQVKLNYVHTSEQIADVMTKSLPPSKFTYFVSKLTMFTMTILFLLTICQSSFALRIGSGRFGPVSRMTTIKLILKITDPCPQVHSAEEALRGNITLDHEGRFNTTWIEGTKFICKSSFDNRVIAEIHSIEGFLVNERSSIHCWLCFVYGINHNWSNKPDKWSSGSSLDCG